MSSLGQGLKRRVALITGAARGIGQMCGVESIPSKGKFLSSQEMRKERNYGKCKI
jgi:NADP-dependent 3-hydroxy acid dehydrogenase YdfG